MVFSHRALACLPHTYSTSRERQRDSLSLKVVKTMTECEYVYDILFNTLNMADPYKDTGHLGTNPELQRSFFAAQKATLAYMWQTIQEEVCMDQTSCISCGY